VKEAVHERFHKQPENFYCGVVKRLVGHWANCSDKQGDYVKE
jgi:hypothetical protein